MTPEERLCRRVLYLSALPGVPPTVQVHLGQAVAIYEETVREQRAAAARSWAGSAAVAFGVTAGAVLLLFGVAWVMRSRL